MLTIGNSGLSGTFSGTIQNSSGTLSLVKTGSGTQVLSGVNTYAGGTTISAGSLQLGNGVTGGTVLGNILDNATLAFNNTAPLAFSNVVSGSGGLVKAGSGVLSLLAANAYSGPTTITAGTLQVGNGGNLGSLFAGGAITIGASGTLAFSRSDTVTQGINFSSGITGSGGLAQTGPGTLVLNGANSYTGVTAVNGGILELATSGSLYGGNTASWTGTNINVAGGATLAVTIGGPSDFSPNGGAGGAARRFDKHRQRPATRLQLRLRHHQLGDLGLGTRCDCVVASLPKRGLSHRADHCEWWIRHFQARHRDLGPAGLQRQHLHGRHHGGQRRTGDAGNRWNGRGERDELPSAGHDGALGPEQRRPGHTHLDEAVGPGRLERHGRQPLRFHPRDWGQAGHQRAWQQLGLGLPGGSGGFDALQRPDQPQPDCLGRQQQRHGLRRVQRRLAFHAADRGSAGGGRHQLADTAGGDLLRRRQPPDPGFAHRQQHADFDESGQLECRDRRDRPAAVRLDPRSGRCARGRVFRRNHQFQLGRRGASSSISAGTAD